jgi:starch phosphorylase
MRKHGEHAVNGDEASSALYQKLDEVVAPCFFGDRKGFVNVMRHAIALNGAYFNAQRMLGQYVLKAYFP